MAMDIGGTAAVSALAQAGDLPNFGSGAPLVILLAFAALLVVLVPAIFIASRYRRCPSNRILVIYGRVGSGRASRCLHGGGALVWPLIQDWAFLALEPMVIDIPLSGALSLNNIRVNVPSTFTVGVSTDPVLMNNAAERLLNLTSAQVRDQAQDIILGQLRLVIATLTIEEINKDREKFMTLVNANVEQEINKIGLELINVNVRDITDEVGYIEAIGKRAAAEAINRAKVEVAQQERDGAAGEARAVREREVSVSKELSESEQGKKAAMSEQRAAVAALETQAVSAEVAAQRDREVSVAQRSAETIAAKKAAEQEQRIRVAEAEAAAITGENLSRAKMAESEAQLGEVQADSRRRREVAAAKAAEAILVAEREQELARLGKELVAPQEIERTRIEIAAAAEAEKRRIEAKGEADAVMLKYRAEAEGVRSVLEAKADGYRRLIESCGSNPQVGPTLLLIEQLPQLVAEQVKAISSLKIDKITVWDTGTTRDGRNTTSDFLAGMVGSLPRLHELARQAGIQLPSALGKVDEARQGIFDAETHSGADHPSESGSPRGSRPGAPPA